MMNEEHHICNNIFLFFPFLLLLQCMLQVAKNLFIHLGKFKADAVHWSASPLELAPLDANINLHATIRVGDTSSANHRVENLTNQESAKGTELLIDTENSDVSGYWVGVGARLDARNLSDQAINSSRRPKESVQLSECSSEELARLGKNSSLTESCTSSSSAGSRQILWDETEIETLQALAELGFGNSSTASADRRPLFWVTRSVSDTSTSASFVSSESSSSDFWPDSSNTTLTEKSPSLEVLTSMISLSCLKDAEGIICECCHSGCPTKEESDCRAHIGNLNPVHDQKDSVCNGAVQSAHKHHHHNILTRSYHGMSQCLLVDDGSSAIPCECYVTATGKFLDAEFASRPSDRIKTHSITAYTDPAHSFPSVRIQSTFDEPSLSFPTIKIGPSQPSSHSSADPAPVDGSVPSSNESSRFSEMFQSTLVPQDAAASTSSGQSPSNQDLTTPSEDEHQRSTSPSKGAALKETCRLRILRICCQVLFQFKLTSKCSEFASFVKDNRFTHWLNLGVFFLLFLLSSWLFLASTWTGRVYRVSTCNQ